MPQRAAQGRTLDASIEAAALYFGNVMHARLKPIRFSHRVMSLLIDPRPSRRHRPKIRSIRCEPRGTVSTKLITAIATARRFALTRKRVRPSTAST